MKQWLSCLVFVAILSCSVLANNISFAACPTGGDTVSDIKCGVSESGGTGTKNQGGQVAVIARTVINILLFFIGIFAVIMIVIAGFRLVAANGDANTVSSAKNTIIYAVIGLAVAFLAYALVSFVLNQLIKAKPTCPNPPTAALHPPDCVR